MSNAKVTIKNEPYIRDGQGFVHTWLTIEWTDSTGFHKEVISFGADGVLNAISDKPGKFDNPDDKNRPRTVWSHMPINITDAAKDAMISKFREFQASPPPYNMTPNGTGNYNCVTFADLILKAGGVNYLDGLKTPQTVDAHILLDKMLTGTLSGLETINTSERISSGAILEGLGYVKDALARKAYDEVLSALESIQERLEYAGNLVPGITDTASAKIAALAAAVNALESYIAQNIGQAIDGFANNLRGALNELAETMANSLDASAGAAAGIIRDGAGRLDDIIDALGRSLGDILRDAAAGKGIEDLANRVADIVEGLYDGVGNILRNVADALADLGSEAASAAGDAIRDMAGALGEFVERLAGGLSGSISGAAELGENIRSGLSDVFGFMAGMFGNFIKDTALSGASIVDVLINMLCNGFSAAAQTTSPLVLDLDGDGVETVGLANGVHFDHDGNGFAQQSGWVHSDDGLLVLDRNGNGLIDNGSELFGNNTQLSGGANAANGFAALAELDGNGDGVIDANDAAFGDLRVWRDMNGNGRADAGELFTLSELGIASLNVGYTT